MIRPALHDRAQAPEVEAERDNWRQRGLCRTDPDRWSRQRDRKAAAHDCREHCPVLDPCTDDLATIPPELRHSVVIAGVIHDQDGEPAKGIGPEDGCRICDRHCCPVCGLWFDPPNALTLWCSPRCKRTGEQRKDRQRRRERRAAS